MARRHSKLKRSLEPIEAFSVTGPAICSPPFDGRSSARTDTLSIPVISFFRTIWNCVSNSGRFGSTMKSPLALPNEVFAFILLMYNFPLPQRIFAVILSMVADSLPDLTYVRSLNLRLLVWPDNRVSHVETFGSVRSKGVSSGGFLCVMTTPWIPRSIIVSLPVSNRKGCHFKSIVPVVMSTSWVFILKPSIRREYPILPDILPISTF